MDKSEYYRLIRDIVEEGYGWQAIKDITRMMEIAWENHEKMIREIVWEGKMVRRVIASDKGYKHKVETLQGLIGEDGES